MSLRAVVVDDEHIARARMRRLLQVVGVNAIEVIGECVNVAELHELAADCEIDVVFLDIKMPDGSGFDALAQWPGKKPMVVFVTAYGEFGPEAYEQRAIDYLMKPLSADRLRDTVERLTLLAKRWDDQAGPEVVIGAERIPLQIGNRTRLVPVDRINLVKSDGNYLDIVTSEGTYTLRSTLTEFQSRLDPAKFMRVHRSAIVRVAAIREIEPVRSSRFKVVLEGGKSVNSGRNFREKVQLLITRQDKGNSKAG